MNSLQTIKKTIIQANIKHKTIHHFIPPLSSIDGAASNVVRYQKYAVSDERAHSGSIFVPLSVDIVGHSAHGNGL